MPGGLTSSWVAKLGLVVFSLAFAIAAPLAANGRRAMPALSEHRRPADGGPAAAARATGAGLRVSAPVPAPRSLDRLQRPGRRRPPKRRVATTPNVAAQAVLQEATPSPEPSPTPTPAATAAPPTPAAPAPVATPVPVVRAPDPTPAGDRPAKEPDGTSGDFDLTDGSP